MTSEVLGRARSDTAEREAEVLVDATFRVIAATGTIDPAVRDILREGGVSTPVFYRHFRSKDELLLEVWDRGAQILAAYLHRRMTRAADPLGRIRAWIDGVMRQAGDPRSSTRTRPFAIGAPSLSAQFPDEHEHIIALLLEPLTAAISDAAAAGLCTSRRPDADARIIYDFVFARLRDTLLHREPPGARTSAELVDFAMRALQANS